MIQTVKGFGPDMPYDAKIDRLAPFALFDLKGPQDALAAWAPILSDLPQSPNIFRRDGDAELCHIGPNRWILRAPLDQEDGLEASLRPTESPPEISIVRVSDTLTFFRITGPDAGQVLSIGCPLDIHEQVFGPHAITYTEFFGVKALVLRCDGGFDCAVEQSFGDMIADYLARAMA